jgi:moderate conductance mechanosensitive channel
MLETITNTIVLRLEWVAQELDEWAFGDGREEGHLLNILLILAGAWLVRRLSTQIIGTILKRLVRPSVYPSKSDRQKRIKTLRSLASGVIRVGVYAVTLILIVGEIKPGSTGFLFTSAGVVGIVIGFGAQSLIKDLVTGIFIIIENQFRIGDEVSLAGMGLGSIDGIVEDVTIRTTVLRDLSGNVHHLPNGNIILTTNKTLGYSRMNEVLVVPYETDLDKLEKIIKKVGQDMASIPELQSKILEPPQMASVRGFTEKGVAVRILAKTSAASQWKLRGIFFRHLQKELAKGKIKIVGHEDAQS